MRSLALPLATVAAVYALGNALAQHAWPLAALLTVIVAVGLWVIASAASGAFPVARLANSRLVDAGTAGEQ